MSYRVVADEASVHEDVHDYYPPGGETLSVRIVTLEANGPPGVISALALVHVAITFAAVAVAWIPFRMVRS